MARPSFQGVQLLMYSKSGEKRFQENSAYAFSQGKLTFQKEKFLSSDEDTLRMGYRTQAVQATYKIFKE